MKTEILEVLKESVVIKIDIDGAVMGIVNKVLEPALNKIVADTSNPIDDSIVALLLPLLKKEVASALAKLEDKLEEKIEAKLGDIID